MRAHVEPGVVVPVGLRGVVLVAGPDGAGKTTIADRLAAAVEAGGTPVLRAHFAPGILVARRHGGGPVTDPHGRAPRGPAASVAKLAVTFVDFVVGWALRWRRGARRGLVVLERGWHDQVVDPVRYRLDPRAVPLARALGRLLPRADLCVLATGDPAAIVARKPEITADEVARQQRAWREAAGRAARAVHVADTVAADVNTVVASAVAAAADACGRWVRPVAPARLALAATPGPDGRAAAGIYRPTQRRARVAAAWAAGQVRTGGARRVAAPLNGLGDLAARIGLPVGGVAVMRSQSPGRFVVGFAAAGRLAAVAKLGPAGDPALAREAEVLGLLDGSTEPAVPRLAWVGDWEGHFVVATWAVHARGRTPRVPVAVAAALSTRLTRGIGGVPLVHGDFASWNFLETPGGLVLADWEAARFEADPLWDLTHFVVREGALCRRLTPRRAARLLAAPDGPGAAHLAAVGADPAEAPALVACHLGGAAGGAPGDDARVVRFAARLLEALG